MSLPRSYYQLRISEIRPNLEIQRTDVDNFFGSFAESDFLALQERGKHNLLDILTEKELSRLLKPRIVLDGETVEHFITTGPVPQAFSTCSIGGPAGGRC